MLSGDIEMNPGPAENVINKSICFSPQDNSILVTKRLHRHEQKFGFEIFAAFCVPVV